LLESRYEEETMARSGRHRRAARRWRTVTLATATVLTLAALPMLSSSAGDRANVNLGPGCAGGRGGCAVAPKPAPVGKIPFAQYQKRLEYLVKYCVNGGRQCNGYGVDEHKP
jgi:hypothetical protein